MFKHCQYHSCPPPTYTLILNILLGKIQSQEISGVSQVREGYRDGEGDFQNLGNAIRIFVDWKKANIPNMP